MSKYAIQVEGLGKEYIIGGAEQRHDSFREMMTGALTAPFRKLKKLGGTASEEERFWALKDVSFNVEQGEVLGIIGRNGAGKSTLLKILSRITSPTEGKVRTRGRVASLLEVGTGFHPELTGRENIHLNGAILGMTRAEIDKRFDQIVAFSEIEKFLDTPVKRYSSGMYVRLAFSVAAHLESDILLVDEVLAVGDSEFQRRCLGKIGSVARSGKTVLFVSHNMAAVNALCETALFLRGGSIRAKGATREIVSGYLCDTPTEGSTQGQFQHIDSMADRNGSGKLRISKITFLPELGGSPAGKFQTGDTVFLLIEYVKMPGEPVADVQFAIAFKDEYDRWLCRLDTALTGQNVPTVHHDGKIMCVIPKCPVGPGRYSFEVGISARGMACDHIPEAGSVEFEAGDFFGTGRIPQISQSLLFLEHEWRTDE